MTSPQAASPTADIGNAVLRWECETCGWSTLVPMPGYAGDGYRHWEGDTPCGPLIARRQEGFTRAHPGADLSE